MTERHRQRVDAYHEWKHCLDEQEIQEKRRIAPGYLDSGAKILTPQVSGSPRRAEHGEQFNKSEDHDRTDPEGPEGPENELDKAFGRVSLK